MPSTAAKDQVEIALIGGQLPFVTQVLNERYIVHSIFSEPDPFAALEKIGARCRAAAGHGMAGLTKRHMELMPNLEICALNGVGLETSDLPEIRNRGIVLTTTPVLFDDVADLAILLALGCCRQIAKADRFVRSGAWVKDRLPLGRKFTGLRVGIMGLGRIGIEVARRLEGFKCQIGYADPVKRAGVPYQHFPDAITLAKNSDILVLAAAGGPKGSPFLATRELFDALGPRGVFVNVARGWLVDEPALIAALTERRLGAAGLDVFYDEPSVPAALAALDNVLLTPHIASSTEETMGAMGQCVLDNLESWFAGRGALTAVT